MPSSRASWWIRRCPRAAPLDKEKPRRAPLVASVPMRIPLLAPTPAAAAQPRPKMASTLGRSVGFPVRAITAMEHIAPCGPERDPNPAA